MLFEQKQVWLAEVIARTSKKHKRTGSLLSQALEALPRQKRSSPEKLVHALQLLSLLNTGAKKGWRDKPFCATDWAKYPCAQIGWVRSELCSTTFFWALQQTRVWSVWALMIASCSTGTTERLHAGSDGALVQPLICTSFFPCCTSPLGNSLSFLNRNHSWLQNKSVWSWAMLGTVHCEVKGKFVTDFKDSSLRFLLQL